MKDLLLVRQMNLYRASQQEKRKNSCAQDTGFSISMFESSIIKKIVSIGSQFFIGGIIMALLWYIGTS